MTALAEEAAAVREQLRDVEERIAALSSLADRPMERRIVDQISRHQQFLMLSLELLGQELPAEFEGFGLVTHEGVNLREGPWGYKVLGRLARGDQVVLQGKAGFWVHVMMPGRRRSGYVFQDYLRQEAGV